MSKYLDYNGLSYLIGKIKDLISAKQDELVSGTNIKTVNNQSLLGSGNISISGGGSYDLDSDILDRCVNYGDYGAIYMPDDETVHAGGSLPVEYGGTGASTAASARLALGVPIGSITRYLNTNYTCTASDAQLANLSKTLGEYDPHNILSVSGGNVIVEAGYVVEVSASGVVMGTTSHGNSALSIYKGTGTALSSKSVLAQSFASFPLSSSKSVPVSIAPIIVQCTAKTYFALTARSTSAGATVSSGGSGSSATSIPTTMLNVRVIGKI